MSTVSPAATITTPAPTGKTLTFFQWCVAVVLLTGCGVVLMGAAADAYCDMRYANRPIRGAIARVINKVADALGWIPFVIPFLDVQPVPQVEHRQCMADELGNCIEQDHGFEGE